jgi:hypothetical protein
MKSTALASSTFAFGAASEISCDKQDGNEHGSISENTTKIFINIFFCPQKQSVLLVYPLINDNYIDRQRRYPLPHLRSSVTLWEHRKAVASL